MLAALSRKIERVWLSISIAAAMLASATAIFIIFSQAQHQNDVLREKLVFLSALVSSTVTTSGSPDSPLPHSLPDHLSLVVREIDQLSQQRGLFVSEAKYSPVDLAGVAGVSAMRIESRIKGGYKELKNFLADVLAAHEGLSLDALSIRRATAADTKVDVQLTFSLYYRKRS